MTCLRRLGHTFLYSLAFIATFAFAAESSTDTPWVATWAESPFGFQSFGGAMPPPPLENQTLRQVLRISVGGSSLRIRFSNALGTEPLVIGAATVAIAGAESAIEAGSLRQVTFGGSNSITVPPGAPALSDPIDLSVQDLTELAISMYLPEATAPATLHMGRTAFVSGPGDFTGAGSLPGAEKTTTHLFLNGVYVQAEGVGKVVVAFGDSITDGTASTPHTFNSWPDHFAARLPRDLNGKKISIVNHGISGNQVLRDGAGQSALTRFDNDVLSTPGLTHVVIMEGINDVGTGGMQFPGTTGPVPPLRTAADLIAGYQQLIARAHSAGVQIIGATLPPFEGVFPGYYSPEKDLVRKEINTWIRTSGQFDGVIDFEAAIRDESNPDIIKAEYNSGDNLHPGDAGYTRMANYIDTAVFE